MGKPRSTSEFDQTASDKIYEVFISDFSVLGIVQNGELRGENSWKIFSKASEISENSEFSTSPNYLVQFKDQSVVTMN